MGHGDEVLVSERMLVPIADAAWRRGKHITFEKKLGSHVQHLRGQRVLFEFFAQQNPPGVISKSVNVADLKRGLRVLVTNVQV